MYHVYTNDQLAIIFSIVTSHDDIIEGTASTNVFQASNAFRIFQLKFHVTLANAVFVAAFVSVILFNQNQSSSINQANSYSCFVFITEYVYSLSIRGSFGILSSLDTLVKVVCQNIHCVHIIHQLNVISIPSVVTGYFQASRLKNSSAVFIFDISLTLTLFLDDLEYHWSEIKAIVHRIARIVITTINSTSVNAFLVFLNIYYL